MKKLCMLLVPLFIFGLVFTACDSSTSNDQSVPNNKFDQTGTLQGTVYDATTGERIGDETLTITMVVDGDYKKPSNLDNDPESAFMGDYAFKGLPVTLASESGGGPCKGTAQYKIAASMTGYEDFEGYVCPTVDLYDEGPGHDTDVPTENSVYNWIGNILLFPVGSTAPDYTFYLEYDYERVPGATVYFEYKPCADDAVTNHDYNTIHPAEALGQTLTGVTDANGMVTFDGDDLVLGGEYRPVVLPVVYEGVQLGLKDSLSWVRVGTANNEIYVALSDLVPGSNSDGLKMISATNRDPDNIVATGVLTVSFNQVVTLMDETLCGASLLGTLDGGALDATGTPVTDSEVTVTGSGTATLTFTPNLSTALGADAAEVRVDFDSCYITVGDDVDDGWDVFAVPYVDGSTFSWADEVQMVP